MFWSAKKVRRIFLDFFKERGHEIVKSSPLYIKGDPTLLFTNAGMNQFKPYFLREVEPLFQRAASVQKCMRAGGKHNDLDNVGFTKRHHTFFEMLGNFSFGDYFKKEAIHWGYEFLTEFCGLDRKKIWASVYKDDDEAFYIWKEEIGLPVEKILRLGEEDNFWEMGETGPCGPSSEIYYDLGSEFDKDQKNPSEEGERFIELWNLVFMQFNRNPDGTLEPLPKKNIDTGMGLERLLTVLEGVDSNFHTELFLPLIEEVERITGIKYKKNEEGIPHRVISDHIRALTFAIADGIYPSNFGRGYVLRRILRRAHRFAQNIGVKEPILFRLVPVVVHIMAEDYPEIADRKTDIELIIKSEEEKYLETIYSNLEKLREVLKGAKDTGILKGDALFKLYDTYGLPLDLIEDYAVDEGLVLDIEGFDREMEKQRERGKRKVSKVSQEVPWKIIQKGYQESKFVGYERIESTSKIVKFRKINEKIEVILDTTPFYAEAGGQVGDKGIIQGDGFVMEVEDTQKTGKDIIHIGKIKKGEIGKFDVIAKVDREIRDGIQRAHTATHLLHASLREILGEHVRQEGSLVECDRLRFDFTHYQQLSEEEKIRVERLINKKILEDIEVLVQWKSYREALEEGVMAVFFEKYEDRVRVISVGDFSKELCGGTHVKRTGEIGIFKIIKEEAIARGVRRIEAFTGKKVESYLRELEERLDEVASLLEVEREHVAKRIEKLKNDYEILLRNSEKVISKLVSTLAPSIINKAEKINGVLFIQKHVEGLDKNGLRRLSDEIEVRIPGPYILFLATCEKDKVYLISKIHSSLTPKISAKILIQKAGKLLGGGGGGTDVKAEGGGKIPKKLKNVFLIIKKEVNKNLQDS